MAKFTPGPWKARKTEYFNVPDDRQQIVVGTEEFSICRMTASGGTDGNILAMPDAHLIAAAPDMYEALELILELRSKELDSHLLSLNAKYPTLKMYAEAALAKAKGESVMANKNRDTAKIDEQAERLRKIRLNMEYGDE